MSKDLKDLLVVLGAGLEWNQLAVKMPYLLVDDSNGIACLVASRPEAQAIYSGQNLCQYQIGLFDSGLAYDGLG